MISLGLGLGALTGVHTDLGTGSSALSPLAAAGSGTFTPIDPTLLLAWYRADRGTTIATGVSAWNDQSGTGDSNKNALQGTGANQPTLNASDAAFNNQKTITFSSTQSLSTGTWSVAATQALTIFIVAKAPPANCYLVNSGTTADVFALYKTSSTLQMLAPTSKTVAFDPTSPFVGIFQYNGNSSKFNCSQTTTQSLGTGMGTNGFASLMLGNYKGAQVLGGGTIAELAIISGTLTQTQVNNLNTYANALYAIAIGA